MSPNQILIEEYNLTEKQQNAQTKQLWTTLRSTKNALLFPHEIPDCRAIPLVPHTADNVFPVSRSNKLQSVDILKRLQKNQLCLPGESCSSLRWIEGEIVLDMLCHQAIILMFCMPRTPHDQPSLLNYWRHNFLQATFSSENSGNRHLSPLRCSYL